MSEVGVDALVLAGDAPVADDDGEVSASELDSAVLETEVELVEAPAACCFNSCCLAESRFLALIFLDFSRTSVVDMHLRAADTPVDLAARRLERRRARDMETGETQDVQ